MADIITIAGHARAGELDPDIQKVTEELAALRQPLLETMEPAEARQNRAIQKYALPGADVAAVTDMTVPGPGHDVPVRVYHPEPGTVLPVTVFSHGGGWVLGSVDTHDHLARYLAATVPCVVVSVEYRLAPEFPFPAALDDVSAVLAWAGREAYRVDGDPDRIAVCGDSAGGNLSIAAALKARDEKRKMPCFMALLYPVTDLSSFSTESHLAFADGYFLTRSQMEWFRHHYLVIPNDMTSPYVSPLLAADPAGLPPAHIITAEFDPLRDEAETFALCLAKSGVTVTCTRYNGAIHAFAVMGGAVAIARDALKETAGKLRHGLNGQGR